MKWKALAFIAKCAKSIHDPAALAAVPTMLWRRLPAMGASSKIMGIAGEASMNDAWLECREIAASNGDRDATPHRWRRDGRAIIGGMAAISRRLWLQAASLRLSRQRRDYFHRDAQIVICYSRRHRLSRRLMPSISAFRHHRRKYAAG